jgi:hypothetical protein
MNVIIYYTSKQKNQSSLLQYDDKKFQLLNGSPMVKIWFLKVDEEFKS